MPYPGALGDAGLRRVQNLAPDMVEVIVDAADVQVYGHAP